ncbi:MAG: hypothetical protein B1H40_02140 [Candidatus Latescibacteria bacterium 4484_181]|nr:MAG: hypothetical protein B1H40_02140 [Candidatus Latescibacteria bacterium 4484_181]RKY66690.1 MAG: hypothetical protein DRQ02_08435 [Candidatus Latescibacterota bacterium]
MQWESGQPIVVTKQGNTWEAKGLAERPSNVGASSPIRCLQRKSTKPISVVRSLEFEGVLLKSRTWEGRSYGSVKGFAAERKYSRRL